MAPSYPIKKLSKRKSRKCEELRKKPRQINEDSKARKTKTGCFKSGKYTTLTSDRLTLCNKAIRSETITRKQDYETGCSSSKKLSNANSSVIHGKFKINLIPLKTSHHQYIQNKVILSESETSDDDNETKKYLKDYGVHRLTKYQTPESIFSCSVGHIGENAINVASLNSPERASLISSHACLNYNIDQDIYDDFVEELDDYIKDLPPELFKSDFRDEVYHETKKLMEKGNDEPVHEDLFRRNYAYTKDDPVLEKMLLTVNSLTYHTLKDTKENAISSSATHITPESGSTQTGSQSAKGSDDTPEYSYYPHKLN